MRGQTPYGKGSATRARSVPHEVYSLNYDLQAGDVTRAAYEAKIDAAWASAKKRGWRENR